LEPSKWNVYSSPATTWKLGDSTAMYVLESVCRTRNLPLDETAVALAFNAFHLSLLSLYKKSLNGSKFGFISATSFIQTLLEIKLSVWLIHVPCDSKSESIVDTVVDISS